MKSLIEFKNGSTLKVDGSPKDIYDLLWQRKYEDLCFFGDVAVNYNEILTIQLINEGE